MTTSINTQIEIAVNSATHLQNCLDNSDHPYTCYLAALKLKALANMICNEITDNIISNDDKVWVMRSSETGDLWGRFTSIVDALDKVIYYEGIDMREGTFKEDQYKLSSESIIDQNAN
jgi:hypothetical protein